ncbi:MAG: universal stress protein [Saprospiraceae bacterium]|nr:universal stress protein [Saprospiraceae bacterium]
MKADTLRTYPQIVVYCRSGNRSAHAKKILSDYGINNVIDGGSLAQAQELMKASGVHNDNIIKESLPEMSLQISGLKDENVLKILIPTDFSVQADYSYLMARKLEEHLSVDVHFLHVMDVPDTVTMSETGQVETCGEIDVNYIKDQKRIAEAKLQQLKDQYGHHITVHFRLGKITDTILQFAEGQHFDLIVMGTKGSWGIKEKVSSSQAQMIARRSEIPLLSLMCDRSDLVIKDVLFVHDFMDNDDTKMPLMHKFSKYFNATYHQLYIHNDASKLDKSVLFDNMDKYAASHQIGKHQNHIIESADVESGVKEFLKIQDADIVFIGTHGQGGFFHKSAAETLIKHLFKPIISFHLKTN